MPHISVKLYPGKSEEMKENLAKAVRKALAEESGVWSPDKFEAETKASFKKDELLIDSKYINFK